jgi:hypothetical protein
MDKTKPTSEFISWKTVDFKQQPKNKFWYPTFLLLSIGLIVFAIYSKSTITLIAFSLLVITVFIASFQKPKMITCKITKTGITAEKNYYPFKNIKKFWILYSPPIVTTLNLETTAYLNNTIAIELGDQNPLAVKAFLQKYLPEDLDKEESVTDVLSRKLKI